MLWSQNYTTIQYDTIHHDTDYIDNIQKQKKHNTDILSKYSFFLSLFSDSAVNNYYSLILFESGCIMDIDK